MNVIKMGVFKKNNHIILCILFRKTKLRDYGIIYRGNSNTFDIAINNSAFLSLENNIIIIPRKQTYLLDSLIFFKKPIYINNGNDIIFSHELLNILDKISKSIYKYNNSLSNMDISNNYGIKLGYLIEKDLEILESLIPDLLVSRNNDIAQYFHRLLDE